NATNGTLGITAPAAPRGGLRRVRRLLDLNGLDLQDSILHRSGNPGSDLVAGHTGVFGTIRAVLDGFHGLGVAFVVESVNLPSSKHRKRARCAGGIAGVL